MAMARRVLDEGRDIRAEGSHLPSPITSGEFRRAPTTIPGWSLLARAGERAAQPVDDVAQGDGEESPVFWYSRPTRSAATSVSVSLLNDVRWMPPAGLQLGEFSMMPLWI
jgi:hypothetical protein